MFSRSSRFAARPVAAAFGITAAAFCIFAAAPHAALAQTLTDITVFRLDGSNNAIFEGSNTRGSDGISNLYLKSGANFINGGDGSFVGAGGANIAIDLSVPATYNYSFAFENVNTNTNTPLGINFFFNNNAATPGISARGPQGGGFVANGNVTKTPTFADVTGVNTLTFFNNGRQITLSNFAFQTTGGAETVSSSNNVSNGLSDTNGSFTLTVSGGAASAPEPASLALLGAGIVPLAGLVARRRRNTKTTA